MNLLDNFYKNKLTGMLEIDNVHFLKISGIVDKFKKSEFIGTVKFACNLLPSDCIERSLANEILEEDLYYFFSLWSTRTALRGFMESEEYQLIRGAYDALGILKKIEFGYGNEIRRIRII
jgi:hypothetical protein